MGPFLRQKGWFWLMAVEFSIIRRLLAVVVETHGAELPISLVPGRKGEGSGSQYDLQGSQCRPHLLRESLLQ